MNSDLTLRTEWMVLSFIIIENMEEKHNVALFVSGVGSKKREVN